MLHGDLDKPVPLEQSELLKQLLDKYGVENQLFVEKVLVTVHRSLILKSMCQKLFILSERNSLLKPSKRLQCARYTIFRPLINFTCDKVIRIMHFR